MNDRGGWTNEALHDSVGGVVGEGGVNHTAAKSQPNRLSWRTKEFGDSQWSL